jgi:cytochrome oxidase Cu insertion factor (SCO1/SenC/PrrC family)
MRHKWWAWGLAALAAASTVAAWRLPQGLARSGSGTSALYTNPDLDPGTPLSGKPAPNFTLVDQFGQHVSLSQFRGRVVLLAFVDSQCTTICPHTTASMVMARRMLGAAGTRVALLGIDANPQAISVADVRAYSQAHGMMHLWHFLTGSLSQLRRVWRAYGIYVQVVHGMIDHTPALFLLNPQGREVRVYLTQMAYAAVDQQAQILAQDAARLLPGHPPVHSNLSYETIPGIGPRASVVLPGLGGPSVRLGPGQPRLVVFVASWLGETSNLPAQLRGLSAYASEAAHKHWPQPVLVDVVPTEPSTAALASVLRQVRTTPALKAALDRSGRVADGYGVQDLPWYVVTSSRGRILWQHDGWVTPTQLERVMERLHFSTSEEESS